MKKEYPKTVNLESKECPIGCVGIDIPVLNGVDRLHQIPGRFSVVKCSNCRLMRTNPRPTAETIGAYYPADYGPYQDKQNSIRSQPSTLKKMILKALGFASRNVPNITPGSLIEIGCSHGEYLLHMIQQGWDVQGIEFSEDVTQQALKKGLRVQSGTVETADSPSSKVDIIAAWMVLEHLHDPILALRRMRTWINPEGYLVGSVPDAGSLERRIFGRYWFGLQLPTHLYHFTPSTLERMMSNAGWKIEKIFWQRNCNNFLWSLEYLAVDKSFETLAKVARWIRVSSSAGKFRIVLSALLGLFRQSGRIEFWARPCSVNNRRGG